jgi:hypothetical protein
MLCSRLFSTGYCPVFKCKDDNKGGRECWKFPMYIPLKGIVSRDLEVYFFVSFDRYEVAIPYEACSLAFKISFRIVHILRLGVVYLFTLLSRSGLLDFPQLLPWLNTGIPIRGSREGAFGGKILKLETVLVRGLYSIVLRIFTITRTSHLFSL